MGSAAWQGRRGCQICFCFLKVSCLFFCSGQVFFSLAAWQKTGKRTAAWLSGAQLLSAMLCFTELLGTGLRLTEAGVFGKAAEGAQLLTAAEKQVYLDSWQSWAWTVFTAVALSAYLEPFLFRLETFLPTEEACFKRDKKGILSVFFKSWILLFLGYLPCFLAFYPGLYCYDMTWQWDMYWTGDYSTHHPLLHTYLCGWLFELGNTLFGSYNAGLALQSLLQTGILTGCMAFAAAFLAKWGFPGKYGRR